MRAATTIFGACLAAVLGAPAADAATATVSGTTLQVVAQPGETNQIAVTSVHGGVSVTDTVALTPGPGCTVAGAGLRCTGASRLSVDLGDGDDRLTVSVSLALTAVDGPGDDRVTGAGAADTFVASPGADLYQGAGGSDTVTYAARTTPVLVDLAGGTQEDAFTSVENAIGGSGADALFGTGAVNLLDGGPGDDTLDGRTGADRLVGGAGSDTADYSRRTGAVRADLDGNADDGESYERDRIATDVEHLRGGTGADTLTGNELPNRLDGGAGNDTLDGNGGDDALVAGAGDDRAWGDAGNDVLALGDGKDQAWGDAGNDAISGGAHDDAIAAGDGNDTVAGEDGNDTMTGDGGSDAIAGGAGNDVLDGGAGDDVLDGGAGADGLSGADGNDRLAGATEGDVLAGGNGDDVLDGGPGGDVLTGGAGLDTLAGAAGDDSLAGEAGNDRLSGADGADRLSGGGEDDVLSGGPGADDLAGDDGWDTADYTGRADRLIIDVDDAADDGARGEADNVRTTVEAVIGGAGDDAITGNGTANHLYGEAGDDRLAGGGGNDRIFGGGGRDSISGGKGADSMDGGAGADTISARDGSREAVRCGGSRDRASTDTIDMLFGCEKRTSGTHNWTSKDRSHVGRVKGVRARTGGGGFVAIPGFPGERIDRRLLPDIRYLQRRFNIQIVDGYALHGHARGGEHQIGLAVDIVPGPGGSWADIDRLAKWAEPRRNRPRSPFRWVGYDGDKNHGRGNHLHLSWKHSATRRGRPARTVYTLRVAR